jgi:predicted dehydrogenase
MNKVRWGLLSTANINSRLIPAIRSSKRGELVAVASRDHARARTYAARWEIPHAFGSYEAMLASDFVDAVYISLPNHLHAEWSIRAMQMGKHVLCEKPFAITIEEVDRIIAASERYERVLTEAFMYRHHPQTRIAGEWVRSGRLGEVSLVRGVFHIYLENKENIHYIPECGGGSLWDVGIYPLSFAQYIYGGPPQRVLGFQWTGDTGVDETFVGNMQYSDCQLAQITSSFHIPFYTQVEIMGMEGSLVLNRPFVFMEREGKMVFHPKEGNPYEIPFPREELYLGEVRDMHAAILDGAETYIKLGETRDHVRTVLALQESVRTGQIVQLGLENEQC